MLQLLRWQNNSDVKSFNTEQFFIYNKGNPVIIHVVKLEKEQPQELFMNNCCYIITCALENSFRKHFRILSLKPIL